MRSASNPKLRMTPPEQTDAPLENIIVSGVEIARIPRIGNRAAPPRELEKQMDLACRIAVENAPQVRDVSIIHADDDIERIVVGRRDPTRALTRARYTLAR